MEQQAGCTFDI